jgi:hypothetical protein
VELQLRSLFAAALGMSVSGCVTASMQGYADRVLPSQPVTHIAALVSAPLPLAQALQASLGDEALIMHVKLDDALAIFPPTRQYSDAEVKRDLKTQGVDAVLTVTVGDSGIMQQYAGTVFSGGYSATTNGIGTVNSFGGMSTVSYSSTTSGTSLTSANPVYHYTRETKFSAKLIEVATGRSLWVGSGQINAGGKLFVGDATSSSKTAGAIFTDLQVKGIVAPPG